MLVAWGVYARHIGLVERLMAVPVKQKRRRHQPQTKVLEFFVAMLAGLPHLQDISRSAHPLDQDEAVAAAWGQPAWADYSGVSRSLQGLSAREVDVFITVLEQVEQPFIAAEAALALQQKGQLVYDLDLTGRPVSSTSSSYPDTAFGYMGDTVRLGYQAALVSMHSPSYGRLWLVNQLHPGDRVSVTEAKTLVTAAEQRTGLRPRRRIELVRQRLQAAEAQWQAAEAGVTDSEERLRLARDQEKDTGLALREWQGVVRSLAVAYEREGRTPTPHCQLTRARRKLMTYQKRLPRCQQALAVAQRRYDRHAVAADASAAEVQRLQAHYQQLQNDNVANPHPVRIVLRIDAGFASRENIAWLIEMGYDLYTKSRSTAVRKTLTQSLCTETTWQRVGGNASLTAWPATTVNGHFAYPLDVALAHYQTGDTRRRSVLLHYGHEDVLTDLDAWFHAYNRRQTIEAGIKEGKAVFQMHHLKVRSAPALRLQEHFAAFAANFVRFAAHWLAGTHPQPAAIKTQSVKHLVQIGAHTSAWVLRQEDVWLLTFTEQSFYAGSSLRLGSGPIQLPLPLEFGFQFQHF
jgi:hypothetical protein